MSDTKVEQLQAACDALRERAERAEAEVKRLKVLAAWKNGALWDLSTDQWRTLLNLAGAEGFDALGKLWRAAASEGLELVREEA